MPEERDRPVDPLDPTSWLEIESVVTHPDYRVTGIIADENDNIVEDSDILLDTNQNNFRAVTAVSCSNCHAAGFIPVIDEVRDIALANALGAQQWQRRFHADPLVRSAELRAHEGLN